MLHGYCHSDLIKMFYFLMPVSPNTSNDYLEILTESCIFYDNYEKIVLTTDHLTLGNYDGILVKNLMDWLLKIG